MKKIPVIFLFMLAACNNATDGDASTDTTNLPADTNLLTSPSDTPDHINSNTGTISTDTTTGPSPDGASSSRNSGRKANAGSNKNAPHDPARIDTMKQ